MSNHGVVRGEDVGPRQYEPLEAEAEVDAWVVKNARDLNDMGYHWVFLFATAD